MLALPFAREAADQHERRAPLEVLARACVRVDQHADALDLREAADVEQHRRLPTVVAERGQLRLVVADRARLLPRRPALRLVDEMPPPVGAMVDMARAERL